MGELEADVAIMETVMINGKNEYANRKLNDAIQEIRHALSDLSDAMFDVTTGP
ncbi:hypothetical protein [Oribacterium sp. NK2B42]|uniref:hypothetical protein n=1 Tax=Oribacterium sp. NK2B42 TaxID=689781 RepID=UPI0003FF7BA4|nr:hypothetical protein [Oribacterium sp. NK2B42]